MTIKNMEELGKALDEGKEFEGYTTKANEGGTWGFIDPKKQDIETLIEAIKKDCVRIKPEPQVIDMSVLIDSVDCEFWDEINRYEKYIGKLFSINRESKGFCCKECDITFDYCRPRLNYWFSANNFEDTEGLVNALHDAGFVVEVELGRGGLVEHFKITGTKENMVYP